MWKRRWESPKKRLHLMIFNSLLQLSINVGMKPGLVMKPLPKSLDVVSLGKVLGNKTETWMISVCMSEHSESVNGAKPGQKDAQEQSGSTTSSSSKELSLVIANVNDPKMTEAKQEDRKHTKKDIALVFFRVKSEQERKLAASQQSSFQGSSIAKVIIPNTKIVHGYDPFAPIDKKRTNVLVDWLKLDLLWYYILRSLLAWLTDSVSYKHFANLKSLGGGRCGCGCFICASELQQRSLDCYMDIDPQQTHNRYLRHDVVTVVCSP
ncbi:unnamed protein product [Brassica napus]|uniref:(rape) hypothetical protein n=1 Tax=Brassica napus TaxID=3708 RepID=A0A816I8J7_BRANA|nr:unnamed protein product [Brassica napus]